jgi:hypothetical protein
VRASASAGNQRSFRPSCRTIHRNSRHKRSASEWPSRSDALRSDITYPVLRQSIFAKQALTERFRRVFQRLAAVYVSMERSQIQSIQRLRSSSFGINTAQSDLTLDLCAGLWRQSNSICSPTNNLQQAISLAVHGPKDARASIRMRRQRFSRKCSAAEVGIRRFGQTERGESLCVRILITHDEVRRGRVGTESRASKYGGARSECLRRIHSSCRGAVKDCARAGRAQDACGVQTSEAADDGCDGIQRLGRTICFECQPIPARSDELHARTAIQSGGVYTACFRRNCHGSGVGRSHERPGRALPVIGIDTHLRMPYRRICSADRE